MWIVGMGPGKLDGRLTLYKLIQHCGLLALLLQCIRGLEPVDRQSCSERERFDFLEVIAWTYLEHGAKNAGTPHPREVFGRRIKCNPAGFDFVRELPHHRRLGRFIML